MAADVPAAVAEDGFGCFEDVAGLEAAVDGLRVGVEDDAEAEGAAIRFYGTGRCCAAVSAYELLETVPVQVVDFEPVLLTSGDSADLFK